MEINQELLKKGYIIECRYLSYDPNKPHVFSVKIKEFDSIQNRIVVVATGYDAESINKAYELAYNRLLDIFNRGTRDPDSQPKV
jgi:hypothetical protein